MRTMLTTTLTGVAALSLGLSALPARADDAAETDRERVAAQVRRTLRSEGGMSDEDVGAMGRDIDRHSSDRGYGEAVSAAVHEAKASGCLGTCLAEAVHQVNRAMDRGKSADEASRLVGKSFAAASGSEAQRRDRVRRDMDAALRDSRRDRMHDRSVEMAGAAGHGGGMHGGQR